MRDRSRLVGRADRLSALDAAAAQEVGPCRCVMVAATARIDGRRATHFAQDADDRVLQQAPVFEVFDQRSECPVELRTEEPFIVGVGVVQPAAVRVHVPAGEIEDRVEVVDRHVAAASFDQPPGHEAALAERVATVAVLLLRRLLREVKRLLGLGRREQVERAGIRRVATRFRFGLGLALHLVDLPQQLSASIQPELGLPGGRGEVHHLEVRLGGIGTEDERFVSAAQMSGRLAMQRPGSRVADLAGQHDRRRQRAAIAEDF